MHTKTKPESAARLIAKVLRDLVATTRFACYADLKPALRARLAALRIRYQPAEIDEAIDLVAASRPLVAPPVAPVQARDPGEDPAPITRAEAHRIYAALLTRYEAERRR